MSYQIPRYFPAITLEPHEDSFLYVVWWATHLDESVIMSMWLPIGVSLEWLLSLQGGKNLLHTTLYRQRHDHGVYLDLSKRRYVLLHGPKTVPTYNMKHTLRHALHSDALEYEYRAGKWYRRTSSGWLLSNSFSEAE